MNEPNQASNDYVLYLPDGSERTFETPVTGFGLAESISKSLSKAAIAVVVDGEVRDLHRELPSGATIRIVTLKDPEALELTRHDCAHIMAEAVQELYPGTQVTIGPAIENGFYYDFARAEPFTPDDLTAIDRKMREVMARKKAFSREVVSRDEAIRRFSEMGEHFKVELIEAIPAQDDVTIYHQGDWFDLCRGPHMPDTGRVGAFKLTKIAGAYWRGDSNREQLQRIYGTAFTNEKDLAAYLKQIEEAEARDHRRLGTQLKLFHQQEESAGSVFWHPKGWRLYQIVEAYMRRRLDAADYQEVKTPQIYDRKFWEQSGHWDKFRENMFTLEYEERQLAVKPMNCPGHVQIFKRDLQSYRDLPLRMAEFGACCRKEPSGALHGLMRVRAFTQDDAHIFCTPEQIESETSEFCRLLGKIYEDFGFPDYRVKFSDRPAVRAGSDETWDRAESALMSAVTAAGIDVEMNPGEGAFYGPKLEFVLRDAIGRDWQCGTLQVDFVLPERLDAEYVGVDGARHRPVMLHRAILGSFERFLAILIEQYAGKFPLWLAPVQIMVATITNDSDDYARNVHQQLTDAGLRAELDLGSDKIGYKIRQHSVNKLPVIVAIGQKEQESGKVAVRRLGSRDQQVLDLQDFIAQCQVEACPPDMTP